MALFDTLNFRLNMIAKFPVHFQKTTQRMPLWFSEKGKIRRLGNFMCRSY